MSDRAIAAALGALAGYALARSSTTAHSSTPSDGPFVYAPPPAALAALAELADALYPSASPALRAAAKGAALLQPQPAQAWLVVEGDRMRAYACPPPPGARIIRTARGATIAEAMQNLNR